MQTILVTGSNGLLGQKLLEKILNRVDFNLVATSKSDNRYPCKDGYVFLKMSLEDTAALESAIERYQPAVVIHTAALTNVDFCQLNPKKCFEVNAYSVGRLSKICAQRQIQLIFISTDFVFDGRDGPYSEEAATHPVNIYGESKLAAEKYVCASGAPWVILRTILVYGVIADKTKSNIVLWAKSELEQGRQIRVVNDHWRMATLVDDLADVCLLAIDKQARGLYHISGSDLLSVAEMVGETANHWGLNGSLITEISAATLNATAERPVSTGFVLDKATAELGYKPRSFKDGLGEVAAQLDVQNFK